MAKKKTNESIWHFLSPGLGEFILPKRKIWYEVVPGVLAFQAVTLGKTRKWFWSEELLILFRDVDNTCKFAWIRPSETVNRH